MVVEVALEDSSCRSSSREMIAVNAALNEKADSNRIISAVLSYQRQACVKVLSSVKQHTFQERDPNLTPRLLVTTLYDVLHAKPQDDAKKLKAAFRKLALAKHPDKLGPFKDDEAKEAANAAFVRIMRAWETLSDPDKRRCAKIDVLCYFAQRSSETLQQAVHAVCRTHAVPATPNLVLI
eukprot:13633-Heterococcus_DN1.PRE.5